ncbi:head GIN domain-containing protein [Sediminibacterium ginsengisoli]|uniref:Putative auto-transporter adhesin, head GIN domain n=1 Tax=Sediminibacterium ginsengisoli TaxID=413434 RepID=A0A1T4QRW5_9BACT|nr:head GIN domain-containing protein [Sediminibacterium ginsengisoli]SKA06231.1 Putative auto-transporter adhesin, head GIN domain [Sediminibacterium ginsengisoli]
MKKILLAFLVIVTGAVSETVHAQNEKNLVYDANAQVRSVGSFTGIEVSGAIDLYLSQGGEDAVAVSASSDEIMNRIRTEVRGSVLHIYFDAKGLNWKSWGNHKMKAYVTFRKIDRVEASGACNVKFTEKVKLDELWLEMSGASDLTGEVITSKLRLDASGASKMSLAGTAEKTNINASGASEIKAYDLKIDYCKLDASGASGIRITVNKELSASASGGSSIYYKGTGLIRDISASGGATVKRRDD